MDHERRKHCSMNPFLTPLCEIVGSNVRICDIHPSLSRCLRNHQFLLPFPEATSTWPSYCRWCKTSPGKGKLAERTESKARRADFFFLYPSNKFWGGWCWAYSGPLWGSASGMMLGKRWRDIFHQLHVWGGVTLSSYLAGKMQFGKLGLTPDSRPVHSPLHFNSLLLLSSAGSWGFTGRVLMCLWIGVVDLNCSSGF